MWTGGASVLCLVIYCCDMTLGVKLRHWMGPLSIGWVNMKHWRHGVWQEKPEFSEKLSHWLSKSKSPTSHWIRNSAVKIRRIIAWHMTRPLGWLASHRAGERLTLITGTGWLTAVTRCPFWPHTPHTTHTFAVSLAQHYNIALLFDAWKREIKLLQRGHWPTVCYLILCADVTERLSGGR